MHERKLFVGAGIRRLRDSRRVTQTDLATQLRISTACLSQMETSQRPVSASVLYGLSQLFGAEAANLMSEDPDRLAADLREALSDPLFSHSETSAVDIRARPFGAPARASLHRAGRGLPRRHGGPMQRFAIGLGCAISDAQHFVYGDDIDLRGRSGIARIGVSCRICTREGCVQRSAPPLARRIELSQISRETLPYAIV